MHALLVSTGTDGDVFPYLALGARLRARGHRVTLVTNEPYQALAAEQGLAFQALFSTAEMQEVLANPDFWHPVKSSRLLARWGVRFLARQYELLADLAQDEDAVLVANPGVLAARLVQEKLSRPLVSILLQPWMIPSVVAPPVMPGGLSLPCWAPRWLGRMYWRLLDVIGYMLFGRDLNRLRATLGLRPIRRVFQWWMSPERVIGMFPDWYGPPQVDWPRQIRLTGFPLYDGRTGACLPADVLEFCRAGQPPVAFTFGTGMMHAAALFRAAGEACRMLGVRGLLLTKYESQLPAELPPGVQSCAFAPFRQLFPHCAAVVHHGGVGTVAQALAAGTPQLIVPWAFDQEDNATRVQRLGMGAWLPPNQRNAVRIARTLARLLTAATQARCRAVAARFGDDDALERTAEIVEEAARAARTIGI
jgi:rhamnosyltransferase subunit B